MPTISLCMIVKNEEDVLARCLNSVCDLVEEIIIVDTGSTDKTREIAKAYTPYVYDFAWQDDFALARNFAFSKATMDFCMWLDADDILKENDRQGFLKLKESLALDVDVVMMVYNTGFDEQDHPTFSYNRERIVRNHRGFVWQGAVHEVIVPRGKILYSKVAVSHKKLHPSDPMRNLRIYESMLQKGQKLGAREKFYYARELYYHKRYAQAVAELTGFLHEGKGWVENNIEACITLFDCYMALEKEEEAIKSLFYSFCYDKPRSEVCCKIGGFMEHKKRWNEAVFWYECALLNDKSTRKGGFMLPDCYDYLPHIQLCVCYYQLGRLDKAVYHNELAGKIKPYSQAYLHNKAFFEKEGGQHYADECER